MIKKENIINKISKVPNTFGVYLWKKDNEVIYVGKAKKLKNRLMQYFGGHNNSWLTPKMINSITDFDYFLAKNENDAFIKEQKLIKEYNPRFNIKLVNKKTYPYINFNATKKDIKIKIGDKDNNSLYSFGPLPPNTYFSDFVDVLKDIYLYNQGQKIYFDSEEKIKLIINDIIDIFNKKYSYFKALISQREKDYSEKLQFEIANKYYKASKFLEKIKERQISEISNEHSIDFFDFQKVKSKVFISMYSYNYGSLIYHEYENKNWEGLFAEFIEKYLSNFYSKNKVPVQIVLNKEMENLNLELNDLILKKVRFSKKGILYQISDLLMLNNKESINKYLVKHPNFLNDNEIVWEKLKNNLGLSNIEKIFIFDNSFQNHNKNVVGSVVAFDINGKITRMTKTYDLTNIVKNINKHSDIQYTYYNAIYFLDKNISKIKNNDIFIADGSMAQVKEIKEALLNFNLQNNVFGLVKDSKHKTKKIINDKNIILDIDNEIFNFLSKIQTQVDQNAKYRYNKVKNKNMKSSEILNIKGIGEKTLKNILSYFKTIENLKKSNYSELENQFGKRIAKLFEEADFFKK
ncbi:GIY-YIG nuclease family protein [Mycoplasma sp. CSL7491-lung]|uniref:GIY-YIG nuclease family protein n=1 Tax=Mycoplasma sp. CSL7491-lung TaxID=549718 RepID=UPI001C10AD35|nr:GIY-YIG nuclease family protein [Mycoplasma sp. CSL7491-lung]MBU4692767.1 GIY-YIG nuclease family protein [Mycoplasma sp. CSL7491-lung]